MKQYFTKYLPVEGEIKHNDLYLVGRVILPRNPLNVSNDDDFYKGKQKVKLFLCSRDIQVDDKIQYNHGNLGYKEGVVDKIEKETNSVYIHGFNYHYLSIHNTECLKVIGEISPDATWVKEGDEFDENEIENWSRAKAANGFAPFRPLKREVWFVNAEARETIYKIKGPCGHFH